ncbi:MAG: putative manganese-dependent inorganic diphosphatase [Deltaproteobacteria bacterium]|nr:MAG: putative manganese-dependent inorganic diphosphatase [Deltaproteobacteria bacterium]
MSRETVYVVGHRNPDTDSICSAIGYAELCRRQGRDNVRPARAGELNRQTEFILETLGQAPPEQLHDVFPRVRDILAAAPITVHGDVPLVRALDVMRGGDIRMLPVVDGQGRPGGALVLKRLTEQIFFSEESGGIRRVLTSPASLRACLGATALHLRDADEEAELDIYVGAMASQTFRQHLAGADPARAVVFTGDRARVQRDAIEMGVRVLVVTGGLAVADEVVTAARERGVSLLVSPRDTAASALLARLSTPARHLADRDVPTVSLEDRVEDVKRLLLKGKAPGVLALDRDGRVAGVVTKTNLLTPSAVKLVLVDHNELTQALPGADQVEILEVIDHHRLGNFHTEQPIRFINQPLGSTCSVVATLYRQAGLNPEGKVAGLLLGGLLSDTVLLKSPTTTATDRELAEWLSRLAGLDMATFGRSIFAASSALGAYPSVAALLTTDFKEYQSGGRSFGVGQVEVVTFEEFEARRGALAAGLGDLRRERRLDLAGLLVTDIVAQNSLLLVQGEGELLELIDYPRLAPDLFELKGVLSRKKQLVPHLLRALRE